MNIYKKEVTSKSSTIATRFLTVKSVMTLTMLFILVYMVLHDKLPSEYVTGIISMIVTYYFTKDTNKNATDSIHNVSKHE